MSSGVTGCMRVLLVAYVIAGIGVLAQVIEVPVPQNSSAGQLVMFPCAVNNSQEFIVTWSIVPHIENQIIKMQPLAAGGQRFVIVFLAVEDTNVKCIVTNTITGVSIVSTALLLVQGPLSAVGSLNSTEVDNCTLHINWTAPYTLQGVPINHYTINITSDEAVLLSDTTNTTEYIHSVIILGEELGISIAAVNSAGTGNSSSVIVETPTSISNLSVVGIVRSILTERMHTNWTYTLHLEENLVCGPALNNTHTVEVCNLLLNNCSSVSGIGMYISQHERSVVASFTDLIEDQNYLLTLDLLYNGGVTQLSRPLKIGTFDLRNISVDGDIIEGRVCFKLTYVRGHEEPAKTFILLKINETGSHILYYTINTTSNCIYDIPPNTYDVIATDFDARNHTDSAVAFTIQVFVPKYNISSVSITPSPIATVAPVPVLIIAAVSTVTSVIAIAIMVVIVVIICVCDCRRIRNVIRRRIQQRLNCQVLYNHPRITEERDKADTEGEDNAISYII